jgi:RND superfamily putative drug exporter
VFAVVGGRGAGGSQIVDVGAGLAIGVIMDTFVVRTVLVPCTVVLLGRWNWWPSKLSVDSPLPDAVSASADALGLSASADRPEGPAGAADADSESRRNS